MSNTKGDQAETNLASVDSPALVDNRAEDNLVMVNNLALVDSQTMVSNL